MTVPRATYRVQLHAGFDFEAATGIVPYLAALGISHLYTSPILQAERGSQHGYDVIDHSRISDELGGEAAFGRMVAELQRHRMGLVVDVVPNHMAIGPGNRWWWDVLQRGRASPYAAYFDVDWDPPEARLRNAILLPVLPDHYGRVLESGKLQVRHEADGFVVAHAEQRFPLDPASLEDLEADASRRGADAALAGLNADPDRLDALLGAQHYRLAYWRASRQDLGYRRFFDIDTLVGLRVEETEVFEATHRRILELVAAGQVQGLRIDHPDGLRDPAGYFARLRAAAPGAWIVAEKILEPGEELPDWPIDGTTGYRFANLATQVQVDRAAEDALTTLYADVTAAEADWETVAVEARRDALRASLGSDLNRLTDVWLRVCEGERRFRDFTRHELREALGEMAVAFDVYRTYVRADDRAVSDTDRRVIGTAAERAASRRPDLDPELFAFLAAILRLEVPGPASVELAMRFQQLTPAAMAKGVEDTAFYRYLRFVAVNEVGGDPGAFGMSPDDFHAALAADGRRSPAGLLTTSTHDTKRSEDVRARLAVLAEAPGEWRDAVARLSGLAERQRSAPGVPGPEVEYLLFQVAIGAWPLDPERAVEYMAKATREAKRETSWTDPDPGYDAAVASFTNGCLDDDAFGAEAARVVAPLIGPGRANGLAQLLWKLTAPGVPDLYQGSELWDLHLVDPDNRRPVDYGVRRRLLAELPGMTAEAALARADEGLPKLWLLWRALALRARRPAAFAAGAAHRPLPASGAAREHVVAYARGTEVVAVAPRLPLILARRGGWRDTTLNLPPGIWRDVLADGTTPQEGEVRLAALLRAFPVALLARDR